MPNFVTHYQYGPLDGTYILPPITYPDGKIYLKVKAHIHDDETRPSCIRLGHLVNK